MSTSILPPIKALLKEKGPLPPDAALADYAYLDVGHIDSLAFIKFIFRVEEQFNVQFDEHELAGSQMRTVGGLVALIQAKLQVTG